MTEDADGACVVTVTTGAGGDANIVALALEEHITNRGQAWRIRPETLRQARREHKGCSAPLFELSRKTIQRWPNMHSERPRLAVRRLLIACFGCGLAGLDES